MALTPEKILLFLGGVAVAGGGTAYVAGVFDPFLKAPAVNVAPAPNEPSPKVAALPERPKPSAAPSDAAPAPAQPVAEPQPTAVPPSAKASPENPATPETDVKNPSTPSAPARNPATPDAAAKADPSGKLPTREETAKPAGVQPPTFDLVRVEADGSIVIAGKAAPRSKVGILAGTRVIGTGKAGDEGDFAIVIDEPLKPGDYQLVLTATGEDKIGAMSAETAVVSIPETPDGQVLALVEQPGKASELITVPEAKPAPGGQGGPPAQPTVDQGPKTTPAGGDAADTMNTGSKPAQAAAETAVEKAATEAPAPGNATAAAPENNGKAPAVAGATASDQPPSGTPTPSAPAVAHTKPAKPQVTASAQPDAAPDAAPPRKPASPRIAVEAVEIEGRTIFVAGSGAPGSHIRAYANDMLLGDDTVSTGGRFLVEAQRDLKVGDYIIRIDVLAPDGVKVLSRAAVPFAREAGESIAAIAPPAAPTNAKPAEGKRESQSVATKSGPEADKPIAGASPASSAAPEPATVPKPPLNEAEQETASATTNPFASRPMDVPGANAAQAGTQEPAAGAESVPPGSNTAIPESTKPATSGAATTAANAESAQPSTQLDSSEPKKRVAKQLADVTANTASGPPTTEPTKSDAGGGAVADSGSAAKPEIIPQSSDDQAHQKSANAPPTQSALPKAATIDDGASIGSSAVLAPDNESAAPQPRDDQIEQKSASPAPTPSAPPKAATIEDGASIDSPAALAPEDESAAPAPNGEKSQAVPEVAQQPETLLPELPETSPALAQPPPDIATSGSGPADVLPAAPASDVSEEVDAASATDLVEGEVMAPALQSVDGSVIIRRGDTLWRISRRVYGYGTRYSTIYLANQPQIEDPDRIWPGQVFSVPQKSKEGEQADLGQLGDQAVEPAQN